MSLLLLLVLVTLLLLLYFKIIPYFLEINPYKNSFIFTNDDSNDNNNNNNNNYDEQLSSLNVFYNIAIYKSIYNDLNFMIVINPQRYYFFLENGKLIYHPKSQKKYTDGILKNYFCRSDLLELAYDIPLTKDDKDIILPPTVICHLNLTYLEKYIYNDKGYKINFDNFVEPLDGISYAIEKLLM